MNIMQQALMKANIINEEDLNRVQEQEKVKAELKNGAEENHRWNKALKALPPKLSSIVHNLNKKYPTMVSLFLVEDWAKTFTYAKRNNINLPPDFVYTWLRDSGLIK